MLKFKRPSSGYAVALLLLAAVVLVASPALNAAEKLAAPVDVDEIFAG